jgi:hypothetical protein
VAVEDQPLRSQGGIRQRLKDRALELPHLVIAVTPDGRVALRSNVSADVLRSFGEDLKNVADELTAPPEPGRHDALMMPARAGAAPRSVECLS